jgi:hypothetical protein
LLTPRERTAAKNLLDMINDVEAQRADAQREYDREVLKELTKQLLIRQ